jgi:carboxymethylenebutenolidase
MCFPPDAVPPVPPVRGASIEHHHFDLTAADGTTFIAFAAQAEDGKGPAVVVLPDVRGLFGFYEELALRFAEHGYDAVAIDYFGRTAGTWTRDEEFPFRDHVAQTTFAGVSADAAAAVAHLRVDDPARPVFTVGFCFGGSNSWHLAANRLGLAGAVGFYGHPNRVFPAGSTPVIERVGEMDCPILGLMGGDDPSIPPEEVDAFRRALENAGVEHEIVVYPDAPHSFFDRHQTDFAEESADAWRRILDFLEKQGEGG